MRFNDNHQASGWFAIPFEDFLKHLWIIFTHPLHKFLQIWLQIAWFLCTFGKPSENTQRFGWKPKNIIFDLFFFFWSLCWWKRDRLYVHNDAGKIFCENEWNFFHDFLKTIFSIIWYFFILDEIRKDKELDFRNNLASLIASETEEVEMRSCLPG